MVSPQAKREAVTVLMTERNFGVTRACGLRRISRALYRYQSRRPEPSGLRERIDELAALKRRYGYRRIHVLLRREGWRVNRKLTYRLYREAGLAVRRRKRKRIGPFERRPLPKPTAANRWLASINLAVGDIHSYRSRASSSVHRNAVCRVSCRISPLRTARFPELGPA
jgi:putative transposase